MREHHAIATTYYVDRRRVGNITLPGSELMLNSGKARGNGNLDGLEGMEGKMKGIGKITLGIP